jgi:hypothetical protein
MIWMLIAAGGLAVLLAALVSYAVARFYIARSDRTYMTQNDEGFKRALKGRGVLWDYEEAVVKGPAAPKLEYVSLDAATGGRRLSPLLDARTGAINLRPQYCAPLPFAATTSDGHVMQVEARVQFSLNRMLLKYAYQLEDFATALETRIQSAFRAEMGRLKDEELRAQQQLVAERVVALLRKQEADGDEIGEAGMALGVNFHTASFTYSEPDYETGAGTGSSVIALAAAQGGQSAQAIGAAQRAARTQGVLALRPQQLDQIADVFNGRDPASTRALLAILDMQTRQNIAEALAASGQLVVVTPQELGLAGIALQREAMARAGENAAQAPSSALSNGAGARPHA